MELQLMDGLTAGDVKKQLIESQLELSSSEFSPSHIKLIFKGKSIDDDQLELLPLLQPSGKSVYKMIAMGRSQKEIEAIQAQDEHAKIHAPRIRDDLTKQGQQEMARRKRLGQQMLHSAANRQHQSSASDSSSQYGFGKIETLPNLPNEAQAHQILTQLANDPGILACMKKHKFRVGSLTELYPKGKVGQTDVCVMGLNRNKGQQILLRIRTDDLKGFRKILSIRKVLFHELAHNVHSEHDGNFFLLMRQIEKECNEMDWTQGQGFSNGDELSPERVYEGGTYRLGGSESASNGQGNNSAGLSARELRAQAAERRMTVEEEEIQEHCGCGRQVLFLPPNIDNNSSSNIDNQEMDTP